MARILDGDVVNRISICAADCEAVPLCRDARTYAESVEIRIDAEDILRCIHKCPGSRSCQPAVLALSEVSCVTACNHLAVSVRLCTMDVHLVLEEGRCDLLVQIVCAIAVSHLCLGDGNPRIVVAEDTCIFLVSRRIGGNLTEVEMILLICRLQDHDTVLGLELSLDTVKSFLSFSGLLADACHDAEALRLDEDLSVFALVGADLLGKCVICAQEPLAVPAVCEDGMLHGFDFFRCGVSLICLSDMAQDVNIFLAVLDEHAGDEYGFCDRSFGRSCCLEGFARLIREAVEVQAVIPVGAADERQTVRSLVSYYIVEGTIQMLKQRSCEALVVVERRHLVEDTEIAGLADVGGNACYQPHRIIVEAASDFHVAALCERLILMISGAVRELCGGDVEQSLSCAVRNQMYETEKVLAGITEAHAAADT